MFTYEYHYKMTTQNKMENKTISKLKAKANQVDGSRMPSLKQISELLKEKGVNHLLIETSGWLEIEGMDTLKNYETYYSWNTWNYARKILDLLNIEYEETN